MLTITTLNKPCNQTSPEELILQMSPLIADGIDLLCCQSIAHASNPENRELCDEIGYLTKHMQLTCSCFAADRQQKKDADAKAHPPRGQAIFTGPGIWMLNSGSFSIGQDDCEEAVLFALVRKNGSSVLVFNFHLAETSEQQALQLTHLFQHTLLKEAYGAVALCTDRKPLLSSKKWLQLTTTSCYTPFQFETADNGLLALFNAKNGSITNAPLDRAQETPGLSLTVDIKRTVKSRRSRPSFPLSFREQWLGYRDNRVFA